jgi:hypothetical protein
VVAVLGKILRARFETVVQIFEAAVPDGEPL